MMACWFTPEPAVLPDHALDEAVAARLPKPYNLIAALALYVPSSVALRLPGLCWMSARSDAGVTIYDLDDPFCDRPGPTWLHRTKIEFTMPTALHRRLVTYNGEIQAHYRPDYSNFTLFHDERHDSVTRAAYLRVLEDTLKAVRG